MLPPTVNTSYAKKFNIGTPEDSRNSKVTTVCLCWSLGWLCQHECLQSYSRELEQKPNYVEVERVWSLPSNNSLLPLRSSLSWWWSAWSILPMCWHCCPFAAQGPYHPYHKYILLLLPIYCHLSWLYFPACTLTSAVVFLDPWFFSQLLLGYCAHLWACSEGFYSFLFHHFLACLLVFSPI